MTREDEFIGQLEGYLDEYEGLTPLPTEARDVIRATLPTTKQIGSLGGLLGRFRVMNSNIVRFGIAAAALVLVALLGFTFVPWSNMGEPTTTPTATPEPVSLQMLGEADLHRLLGAKTYHVADPFAAPFTITIPASQAWSLETEEGHLGSFRFHSDVQFRAGQGLNFRGAFVIVDAVENVFADPCHIDGGPMDPPPSPTVDGFVEALTHMLNITAGPVVDIRVGNYGGKAFVLTYAGDEDPAGCTGEGLHFWTFLDGGPSRIVFGSGFIEQIRVIDVGGTIVVISGETFATTSEAVKGEVQRLMDSIAFD